MDMSSLACAPGRGQAPCNKKEAGEVVRPLADFHPSVWGETFLHLVSPHADKEHHARLQQRAEELKGEVKTALASARGHLEGEMDLMDALQRLGLAYHFEEEINQALARIQEHALIEVDQNKDLHVVSLRFRLLRQQGYSVSSDVFNNFKDADGHFRRDLCCSNLKNLLSFYEAAYLGTHADAVLEEAIAFCRGQLNAMLTDLQQPLATEVARALETPLIRRMKRLEARQYISFYATAQGRNDSVMELAKLDFNLVQLLHQQEIRDLTLWWKELGLIQKLSFARDRLVEIFFWILGVYYEPPFSRARMMLTKVTMFVSVLDDIYDSYGTLEELRLLAHVIERWDIGAAEKLPEYMEIYFSALNDTFMAIEDALTEEQNFYRMKYLKEQFKLLVLAYLEEAKWMDKGYIPTLEEYLHVSLISCAYQMLTCASFLGMGDIATKEVFDWIASFPKIVKASTIICRLMDDITSHEFEQKRQHVASVVECYMKENGVSKEKAYQKLYEMIQDAWKVLNHECLKPIAIPLQLCLSPFNLARMMETYYKYNDGYTHSDGAIKDIISLILVASIL